MTIDGVEKIRPYDRTKERDNLFTNPEIPSGYPGCVCGDVEALVLLSDVYYAVHSREGTDTAHDFYAL